MKCCDDSNVDEILLEQLNGFSKCGNVMITTNSTVKTQHVTEVCQEHVVDFFDSSSV